MSFPSEQEEQSAAVVAKYSVVPAKESDHPNAWVWMIKAIKKHIIDLPLYLSSRWYNAKIAQEENKAILDQARKEALLLDARGQYEERSARAAKTREETNALRIKNEADTMANRDVRAEEVLLKIERAMKVIAAKGGGFGLELPNTEEPKQRIVGVADIVVPGIEGSGSGSASGQSVITSPTTAIAELFTEHMMNKVAKEMDSLPALEMQGTVTVGPRDEVRPGTITQSPPPETPAPIVGTADAQAQPATSQATGSVGNPQDLPPTFGMGLKLGI